MELCGNNGIPCCKSGSFYSIVHDNCVKCRDECPFQKRHTAECIEHCSGTTTTLSSVDPSALEMATAPLETVQSASIIIVLVMMIGVLLIVAIVCITIIGCLVRGTRTTTNMEIAMKEMQNIEQGNGSDIYEMDSLLRNKHGNRTGNECKGTQNERYISMGTIDYQYAKRKRLNGDKEPEYHASTDNVNDLPDIKVPRQFAGSSGRRNSSVSTQTIEDGIAEPSDRNVLKKARHLSSSTQTSMPEALDSVKLLNSKPCDATQAIVHQTTKGPYPHNVQNTSIHNATYILRGTDQNPGPSTQENETISDPSKPIDDIPSITNGRGASLNLRQAPSEKYTKTNEFMSAEHIYNSIKEPDNKSDLRSDHKEGATISNDIDSLQRRENEVFSNDNKLSKDMQLRYRKPDQDASRLICGYSDDETALKNHQMDLDSLPRLLPEYRDSHEIPQNGTVPKEIQAVIKPRNPHSHDTEVGSDIDETPLKGRPSGSLSFKTAETYPLKYLTPQATTINNNVAQPQTAANPNPPKNHKIPETKENVTEPLTGAIANESSTRNLTARGKILSQPIEDSEYERSVGGHVQLTGGRDDYPSSRRWETDSTVATVSIGAYGNIANQFQYDENIKEVTERENWELKEWMREFKEQPNYSIYEAIKELPFLKGFQSDGDSIEVFIDCKEIDRFQALAELVHISGADATKFQVTCVP